MSSFLMRTKNSDLDAQANLSVPWTEKEYNNNNNNKMAADYLIFLSTVWNNLLYICVWE